MKDPHQWARIPNFKKESSTHIRQEACKVCGCQKDVFTLVPGTPLEDTRTYNVYSFHNIRRHDIIPKCGIKPIFD